jgi:cobyrinic acid a,c-diamide synthase
MGLFDGFSGRDDTGSTAHIARLLDAPVLVVLDVSAMARSAAALVHGMRDFDPRVRVAGVLLNRVGGAAHAQMVRDAIESTVGMPVVGYVLGDDALHLPERHLGLVPTFEPGRWETWLAAVREQVETTVDLDRVLELARAAPPLPAAVPDNQGLVPPTAIIAVARDAAFNFLYEDNLDLLQAGGAAIVFFSPLHDQALPPRIQALYLCGGFPEMYAPTLAANEALRADIRAAASTGLPIYAECGGLMYLTEEIADADKQTHPMVGLLPGRSTMTPHLTIGYRTVRALHDNWLWRAGETMRGHEFHYSAWTNAPADMLPAYELVPDEFQREARSEGVQLGNIIASYIHLHFRAHPDLAVRMVGAARGTLPWDGITATEEGT